MSRKSKRGAETAVAVEQAQRERAVARVQRMRARALTAAARRLCEQAAGTVRAAPLVGPSGALRTFLTSVEPLARRADDLERQERRLARLLDRDRPPG